MTYPHAIRFDTTAHEQTPGLADPYQWLESAADLRTRTWMTAQDELFATQSRTWPGREYVRNQLIALTRIGSVGTPVWRGSRRMGMLRAPEAEHAVVTVTDDPETSGPAGQPRTLIDPMTIDPTGLTTLDAWQPNPEGTLVAYQLSSGGTEESRLQFLEVESGRHRGEPIDRTRHSPVAFLPHDPHTGDQYCYYVRRLPAEQVPAGQEQYHRRVWLHRVGDDPQSDVEIFGAGHDYRSYFGVHVSWDGRWLVVTAATGTAPRNDAWIADLHASDPAHPQWLPLAAGLDAQVSPAVSHDGRLYIHTDYQAPRSRLTVCDPAALGADAAANLALWSDAVLVAEQTEAVLEDYVVTRDQVVVAWRRHAVSELSVHERATGNLLPGEAGRIALPGTGSIGVLRARPEGDHQVWLSYSDYVTPSSVYWGDLRNLTGPATTDAASVHLSPYATPPGLTPALAETVAGIRTRQVTYPSNDGTPVRMFVIDLPPTSPEHKASDPFMSPGVTTSTAADTPPPSPRPTILYGYGGFGISLTPSFSSSILAWVRAGGVYAIANIRGGGEEGEEWHRDGMLGNKTNSFADFEAGARYLIEQGITASDRLCVSGGSNGGLLVGACTTRHPELFAAVVCSAPLLDMVRYEKFGLGATWNVEYGSAEVAEELDWLLQYSPYHRVRPGTDYPAVLFTVFAGDTRVDPLHARKMCAALQHASTSERPVLMRTESDVGHGARSVTRSVDLTTDTLTFSAAMTGLVWPVTMTV